MSKKLISLLIALLILTSSMTSLAVTKEEASKWHYGNVSTWAKEELLDAVSNGLVADASLFQDCKKNITRKEFSTLAVNLYREIKMEDPAPAPLSTFSDTTDFSVRIAYNLGIIKGVGDGKFAPDSPITREQMAVIMLNAVNSLGVKYKAGDGQLAMKDKGNVSSWAIEGVDFVYENDFMKGDGVIFDPKDTTPVEQAVAIANRVYKEYTGQKTSQEPEKAKVRDDYRLGYELSLENDGLYATFNNSGNKKHIVQFGRMHAFMNDPEMAIYSVNYPTISNDYQKVHFIDEVGNLISYNFRTDGFRNYVDYFGSVSDFSIKEEGKYEGYYLIQEKDSGNMFAYDTNFKKVGPIYTLDKNAVDEYIDSAMKASQEFSFLVNDVEYTNLEIYGGDWRKEKNLWMRPNLKSSGPLALVCDDSRKAIIHNATGFYGVDMMFNNEENSNAGIIFNVSSAGIKNDNYVGYYVGINPNSDTLMVGFSKFKWYKLKEVKLPFDIKAGETYNLEAKSEKDLMTVYVNGVNYLTVDTGVFDSKGRIGVRGWKADVEYSSFYAY